jgi:hypothetical protein
VVAPPGLTEIGVEGGDTGRIMCFVAIRTADKFTAERAEAAEKGGLGGKIR